MAFASGRGLSVVSVRERSADMGPDCRRAWGKMTFDKAGTTFDFVFNGHGLDAGDNYTLIYYPDPWPGAGLICFGSDTANAGGNVHIAGSVETNTDLPAAFRCQLSERSKDMACPVRRCKMRCAIADDWMEPDRVFV